MEQCLDWFAVEPPKKRDSEQSATPDGPSVSPKNRKPSIKIVDVACWACRKRKGKCGGERPRCSSCKQRNVDCAYEFDAGQSRTASLKAKLDEYATRIEDLEFLFRQLQERSDNESALILALIRLKVDMDKITAQLRKGPQILSANTDAGSLLGLGET